MDRWTFRLTKMDSTPVATVSNAYERKYTAKLSQPATATFNIRKDNPILPYLFEDESKLLQVWQNNTLRMWGPIISSNYNMSENGPPSIAVSAADAAWWLTRRLSGGSEKGDTYTSVDKLTTANNIIATLNAIGGGGLQATTRIKPGTDTSGSIGTYTAGPFKESLACINELAHGIDGFDWYMEPIQLTEGGINYVGKFRGAAVVGSEKPVFFEHGTGKRNIRSLGFIRDISTELNAAWQISDNGLEPSAENPTPFLVSFDATSFTERMRMEEVVELAGVNNVALRTAWAEENVRVRKNPRRVLTMTSDIDDGTGRVPQFGTDYWLGDVVTARAVVEGFTLFNGQARVYGVEVAPNNNGTSSVTPILVEEA